MERRYLLVFVLILLTESSFGQSPPGTCEPTDFECDDGTCLSFFLVCNGFPDCNNAEDELSCPSTCEASDFVCDDGTCLPGFFVCDGYPLCPEGEDEDPCPSGCAPYEYYCYSDGSCIPRIYRCDGFPDCTEAEDERFCPPPCEPPGVMCDIYYCIPSFTMCNGFRDCPNGNDELDCPHACETSTPLNMSGSIFSSPNFPAPNTDLTPCSLSASAPRGERVAITFTAFDSYDPDLGCLFELSIHEPFFGTLMEANCGSSIPPPVVSISNTVGILYSTYGKEFRQGKGFEASVKFVNQSDLEELRCEYSDFFDEGYLTSPGFPELYPNNFECVYSIVAPPGQIVRLSFTSFNVEDHSSCDFDNLSIFDVISYTSRLLVKLCGSSLPADLRSSETALSVVFTTDSFVRSTGYNASISFETPECNTVILVRNAYAFYDSNMDCTYLFQAPPGYTLRIPFVNFDPFNCENETFLAYDGNSTTASLLIDFCNFPTLPVSTTGNEMFLVVISTFHFPNFGLFFLIEAVEVVPIVPCENIVFVSSGVFTSPNHPNFYNNNESCQFLAEAPSGKIIGLVFENFDVELATTCSADSVKVYDGRDTNATLLANLCGLFLPAPVRSTSNEMFVTFTSDASGNHRGFQAAFVFLDDPSPSCIDLIVPDNDFSNSEEDCIYYINTGVARHQVVVYFFFLDLDCDLDTLLVFDGGSTDNELLLDSSADICPLGSDDLLNVGSTGNDLLILFKSTNHSFSRGFFDAVAFTDIVENDDCGGVFNKSGITFSSPNYPFNYNNHDDCEYLAVAPAGKLIEVVFSSFSLEQHPECLYDSVKLYDGNSTNVPLLATFCGSRIPESVLSSGNSLLVKFTSDYSVTSRGFKGTFTIISSFFEAGCNQFVNVSGDILRSRNFPNSYGANANCHYLITAPDGKYVQIFFSSFQLDPNCLEDSLMIFDGNSTEAPLLETLCGFEVPKPVKTSGSEAYLVFSSDDSISPYQGFLASVIFLDAGNGLSFDPVTTIIKPDPQQAHFATNVTNRFSVENGELLFANNITSELSVEYGELFFANNITSELLVENGAPCGSLISVNGTVFSSPNYPLEDYDNDVTCTFLALAPFEQLVLLVFDSFDVEFEPSCLWDSLQDTSVSKKKVARETEENIL
ncbi:Cubilin [Holothuria leucospilota]|uniref:Cubilin n=1 Tax=Holothuria leucospilota TaxID=206669 RepID=A0A9Q1C681_HOLLE|nr:Cubilin [Holothuria leucospilota]